MTDQRRARLDFAAAFEGLRTAVAALGANPYNLLHDPAREDKLLRVADRLEASVEAAAAFDGKAANTNVTPIRPAPAGPAKE